MNRILDNIAALFVYESAVHGGKAIFKQVQSGLTVSARVKRTPEISWNMIISRVIECLRFKRAKEGSRLSWKPN